MTTLTTPTLAEIRERLTACCFDHQIDGEVRRAAVAAIVREVDDEPEILLIQRSEKVGDPWSGQMAFPGGHIDPCDRSARHAAERETLEEIGLDLTQYARFIGSLELHRPMIRVSGRGIVVAPFVFELTRETGTFDLSDEVAAVHWAKIGPMLRHENLSHIDWELGGQRRTFPGFDVNGRIVWGMTFRMLNRLFSVVDPRFLPLD